MLAFSPTVPIHAHTEQLVLLVKAPVLPSKLVPVLHHLVATRHLLPINARPVVPARVFPRAQHIASWWMKRLLCLLFNIALKHVTINMLC